MITITQTKAKLSHDAYVEQKTYRFFGIPFLRTFKNIVLNAERYYTLEGIIDKIREQQKKEELKKLREE